MRKTILKPVLISIVLLLFPGSFAFAQDADLNKRLAKRLVQSASVKKGDVVVITGGRHMVPLMEDVAVEVQIAGGFANMWLFTDKVQRAILMDEPEQYLGQKATFLPAWYGKVNALITLPTIEDTAKLYDGIPPARIAKANPQDDELMKQLTMLPLRWVSMVLPNVSNAKHLGVDYAAMR